MEDMTMTTEAFGTPAFALDMQAQVQAEAFRKAVRNPVERGVLVASDALQGCLRALGRLVPDMGWAPPVEAVASHP